MQHGFHDVIASHSAALVEDSLVFLSESTASIRVGCQLSPHFIHSPGSGPTLTARNSAESSWVQEGGCYRPAGAHTLLTSLGKGDAFQHWGPSQSVQKGMLGELFVKRKRLPRVLGLPYLCPVESRRWGTPLTPCFLPPRGQGTSKHAGAESEEGGRMVLQSMP